MPIDDLIDDVIRREGGYSNHPADRGGPTRYGITERVARDAGYQGPMASLPRSVAAAIYRDLYWQRPGLDRLAEQAPQLAEEMFDTAVNMGAGVAVAFLQRALNALERGSEGAPLALDGTLGPQTLGVLRRFLQARGATGEKVLIRAVDSLQGAKYLALAEKRPANRAFLFGWLANRLR